MATRRSSTSAIEMIRNHNRRTFETRPRVGPHGFRRAPHLVDRSRPGELIVLATPCGATRRRDDRVSGRRSRIREPRIHGSGAVVTRETASAAAPLRLPSPRLRVTRALPQPDRHPDTSCRTIRSTRGWSRRELARMGPHLRRFRRCAGTRSRGCRPDARFHARPVQGRLPHSFAKRECVPPRPRCLPSKDPPSGRCLVHSLSPTCGVEPAPFQSPRLAAHGRCAVVRRLGPFAAEGGLTPS